MSLQKGMSESIGGIGGLDLKHQIAPRGTCGFSYFRACQEKEKEKEKDKKKKKKFLGKAGKVGLINEDEAHFFWMKITFTVVFFIHKKLLSLRDIDNPPTKVTLRAAPSIFIHLPSWSELLKS